MGRIRIGWTFMPIPTAEERKRFIFLEGIELPPDSVVQKEYDSAGRSFYYAGKGRFVMHDDGYWFESTTDVDFF